MTDFLAGLRINLIGVFRVLTFRQISLAMFRFDVHQTFGGLAILFLLYLAADLPEAWPPGSISPWGVVSVMGDFVVLMVAIYLAGLVLRSSAAIVRATPALCLALGLGYLPTVLVYFLLIDGYGWPEYIALAVVAFVPIVIVSFRLSLFVSGSATRSALATTAMVALLVASPFWLPQSQMFEKAETTEAAAAEPARVDTEAVYYAQPDLMAAATAELAPQRPGEVDLYAVAMAGYAYERVFVREVDAVSTLLADHFGAAGRVIRLVNSIHEPLARPLANLPNLDAALQAIAAKADPVEDVALLFLTSHGSEGRFSTSFWQVSTNDISPEGLDAAIRASGLRRVIIIVSACYSGSFIEALKGEGRMIITASAADRTSFGCADENEWTWFGDAFFNHALRETGDFEAAFDRASALVREWEAEAGFEPSNPILWVDDAVRPALKTLAEAYVNPRE